MGDILRTDSSIHSVILSPRRGRAVSSGELGGRQYPDRISRELLIDSNEEHVVMDGLADEHAIEWITVVQRQPKE